MANNKRSGGYGDEPSAPPLYPSAHGAPSASLYPQVNVPPPAPPPPPYEAYPPPPQVQPAGMPPFPGHYGPPHGCVERPPIPPPPSGPPAMPRPGQMYGHAQYGSAAIPPPHRPSQVLTHTTTHVVNDDSGECLTCWANLLWFTLGGGACFAIAYFVVGLVLCVTVIGLPFGMQLFKIGWLSAFAFGQTINRPTHQQDGVATCFNCLWLPVGCLLALMHLIFAGIMFATIIGIPFALAHLKLARLAIWPFGADVAIAKGTTTTVTTTTHSYQQIA